MRVATKLVLSVSFSILLMGLIAIVVVFWVSRDRLIEMKDVQSRLETRVAVVQFEQMFRETEEMVKALAVNADVVGYLEKPSSASAGLVLKNFGVANATHKYANIYVLDVTGTTRVSEDPSFLNQNYGFRNYFKRALAGELGVEVARGVTTGQVGYYFSYSVRSKVAGIVGVVVIKMNPESVSRVFENDLKTNSAWILADERAVVLQATKKERVYMSLGTLTDEERGRYGNTEIVSIGYEEVAGEIKNYKGVISKNFFDKTDGEEEKIVIEKVGEYPFFVVLEKELDEILVGARMIALAIALLVGVCVAMAIFLVNISIGRFLSPIHRVRKAVENVRKGILSEDLEVKSGDEFEEVAEVFNEMVRGLRENKDRTEEEVARRTKQLEDLNRIMVGRELKMVELKKEIIAQGRKNEN